MKNKVIMVAIFKRTDGVCRAIDDDGNVHNISPDDYDMYRMNPNAASVPVFPHYAKHILEDIRVIFEMKNVS